MENPWQSPSAPENDRPQVSEVGDGGPACGDCVICRATEAGARAICDAVNVDFDALDAHARAHYGVIAQHTMTAMSDVLVNDPDVDVLGLVDEVQAGERGAAPALADSIDRMRSE